MTTLLFTANEASGGSNEDALIAGAGQKEEPYHYIMFQRHPEDGEEDGGVYFEFNDQCNSAYNCVASCTAARERIEVHLSNAIDQQKQYHSIHVDLEVSDEQFDELICMITKIFRGHMDQLHLSE